MVQVYIEYWRKKDDFIQTIGDILTVIIEEDNEDRTTSTKTSDQ